jgi:hypothetical protein
MRSGSKLWNIDDTLAFLHHIVERIFDKHYAHGCNIVGQNHSYFLIFKPLPFSESLFYFGPIIVPHK